MKLKFLFKIQTIDSHIISIAAFHEIKNFVPIKAKP